MNSLVLCTNYTEVAYSPCTYKAFVAMATKSAIFTTNSISKACTYSVLCTGEE